VKVGRNLRGVIIDASEDIVGMKMTSLSVGPGQMADAEAVSARYEAKSPPQWICPVSGFHETGCDTSAPRLVSVAEPTRRTSVRSDHGTCRDEAGPVGIRPIAHPP
jgi:hypothetical protein